MHVQKEWCRLQIGRRRIHKCRAAIFLTNKRGWYNDFYEISNTALYKAKRDGKNRYSVIYRTVNLL